MKQFAKHIWRWFMSLKLKKARNVQVFHNTQFNKKTQFEHNIKIGPNTAIGGAIIGCNSYVGANSVFTDCKIGRFTSISVNVKVIPDSHPSTGFVSTCPSFFSTRGQNLQSFVKKNKYEEFLKVDGYDVVVGNDVWIGCNVLIKGGIRIGDGAIVAMGSIVTKDVPPYAIVGGVPAKVIKYRFTPEQIDYLMHLKWWDKTEEWIKNHAEDFDDIDKFLAKV